MFVLVCLRQEGGGGGCYPPFWLFCVCATRTDSDVGITFSELTARGVMRYIPKALLKGFSDGYGGVYGAGGGGGGGYWVGPKFCFSGFWAVSKSSGAQATQPWLAHISGMQDAFQKPISPLKGFSEYTIHKPPPLPSTQKKGILTSESEHGQGDITESHSLSLKSHSFAPP